MSSRAFIIGNGPSLKSDQLDKLIDEVTFGVNRIHLIYDQTSWRPTQWVMMDFSNSLHFKEDIDFHSRQGYNCYVRRDIAAKFFEWILPNFPDNGRTYPVIDHLNIIERCSHIDSERFTAAAWHDPVCQMGGSVPTAIQMAAKWGHNPIYLIGMDGNKRGNAENNFITGYIDRDNVTVHKARIANETARLALEIAKRECSARNIQLIDATVGGSAYKALPEVDFWGLFG